MGEVRTRHGIAGEGRTLTGVWEAEFRTRLSLRTRRGLTEVALYRHIGDFSPIKFEKSQRA
jgi:hypothetical protein